MNIPPQKAKQKGPEPLAELALIAARSTMPGQPLPKHRTRGGDVQTAPSPTAECRGQGCARPVSDTLA